SQERIVNGKLSDTCKDLLAVSYFKQEKHWPNLLRKNINDDNPNLSCSMSRCTKKLLTGKASLLKRKVDVLQTPEDDSESECSENSCDAEPVVEGSDEYELPVTSNFIISVTCLQEMLENAAVCKDFFSPLTLLEKKGSRQGLAAMWLCVASDASSNANI
ncbi:Hypothetical predicted protein, partial [Paramuricea clavata]